MPPFNPAEKNFSVAVNRRTLATFASLALLCGSVVNSFAQSHDPKPRGIDVGAGIYLLPSASLSSGWDSNYSNTSNGASSYTGELAVGLDFRSHWSSHAALARFGLEVTAFSAKGVDCSCSYNLGVGGRLDVYGVPNRENSTTVFGDITWDNKPEDISENGVALKKRPILNDLGLNLRINTKFTAISLGFDASINNMTFSDQTNSLGVVSSNDSRNRNVSSVAAELGYVFSPGYSLLLTGEYETTKYRTSSLRDASRIVLATGMAYEVPDSQIDGKIKIGFQSSDFKSANFTDFNSFWGEGELKWDVTPHNNITGIYSTRVRETQIAGSSGYVENAISVGSSSSVSSSFNLGTTLSFSDISYRQYSRNDTSYSIGVSAAYSIFEYAVINANINYKHSKSNVVGAGYSGLSISTGVSSNY